MRKNQVSINLTRFGDQVPKGYPADKMTVNVYADSNNLYAALSEAYASAINVMKEWENVAVSCEIATNVDDLISSKTFNRKYEENYKLSYYDEKLKMYQQLLGYYDNLDKILEVIRNSTKETVRKNLEERLGYSQKEIQNILRINLGMVTAEDVENIREEIKKLEAFLAE